MVNEKPSGLVLGPRIQRYRVRFPARASFLGHFFDIFGMSWEVLWGTVGTFSDWFRKVLTKSSENLEILKILGMGCPGVENVPTSLGSIFNPSTAPKRQYKKKTKMN